MSKAEVDFYVFLHKLQEKGLHLRILNCEYVKYLSELTDADWKGTELLDIWELSCC